MKTILLLILLFISLNLYGQGYKVSDVVFVDSVTLVKIEFSFGRWCVFMVEGDYKSEVGYVFSHGCCVTANSLFAPFRAL